MLRRLELCHRTNHRGGWWSPGATKRVFHYLSREENAPTLTEAIALVNGCLNEADVSAEDSERAYKLLGKAFHAKGLLEQAKENLKKLLQLIPNWQPDPDIDTPSFQRLAEQVIRELQQQQAQPQLQKEPPPQQEQSPTQAEPAPAQPAKTGGSKAFLFIGGGGALVAGLIIALAGGGGGDGGDGGGNGPPAIVPLADPPALPPGNR